MEKKSFLASALLCWFVGFLGIHRFYTGYAKIGILQLITLGGCGIWTFIDLVHICLGKFKDANNQELEDYNPQTGKIILIIAIALSILNVVLNISKG